MIIESTLLGQLGICCSQNRICYKIQGTLYFFFFLKVIMYCNYYTSRFSAEGKREEKERVQGGREEEREGEKRQLCSLF